MKNFIKFCKKLYYTKIKKKYFFKKLLNTFKNEFIYCNLK